MKLEDQVCSLELSKKLLTLGVNQNSLFYWTICHDCEKEYPEGSVQWELGYEKSHGENISAFTASELGYLLPNGVVTPNNEPFNSFRILISKFISFENELMIRNFVINYECDTCETHGKKAFVARKLTNNIYDPNLANAMAKMLTYLLENGLINNE